MFLYMSSPRNLRPIDRVIDVLIDRRHPFWKDERQTAIYNEAAAAALVLQAILVVIIGGIGLLVVGKAAIGIVTAMVLTVTAGQMLIFGVLVRRHVDFDLNEWNKHASPIRKTVAIGLGLFYVACYLWARFHTSNIGDLDGSTIAGMATGAAFAIGLFLFAGAAAKRALRKRQAQDEHE